MSKEIKFINDLKDSKLLYDKKLPAFGYFIIVIITLLIIFVIIWSVKTPKVYMVNSTGVVNSKNKNYVMSPFAGEITEIFISEGTSVEDGDVLFTVESTELNLQFEQLNGQKSIYENQIIQYEKLVRSIKDDKNYFSQSSADDSLYYSQYEAYKSQVSQNAFNASTYKAYGYTDEQIQVELEKNQGKISEIYYTAIQSAERYILEAKSQLEAVEAQLGAIESGQSNYTITANTSGKVHMMSEYKEGMVIQAASAVASISSENDEYIIEAYVSPSDTARINVGDKVDIAIAGLAQSVYGTISGEITNIDSDISTSQSNDGKSSSYFKIQVTPDSEYLVSKDGDKVNIYSGMAVETRIQFNKVTYFNYILESLGVLTK